MKFNRKHGRTSRDTMQALRTWQHPSSPVRPTFSGDTQGPKQPSLLEKCQITLHRASNVPISDPSRLSSDPYILLTLSADPVGLWESKEQSITFRTHTVRRTLNPTFNTVWTVSGIPSNGFTLHLELRDEDPLSTDDRLGQATLHFPPPTHDSDDSDDGYDDIEHGRPHHHHHHPHPPRHDSWECDEKEFRIHKRRGSVKSQVSTFVSKLGTKDRGDHRVRIWISVRNLGLVEDQEDKRLFTVGPHRWFQHFSPHLGIITGTSLPSEPESPPPSPESQQAHPKSFVANRLQLSGPFPVSLCHQYVPFAPFVKLMFTSKGVEGALLNKGLKKQYKEIYKWDEKVKWGVADTDAGDWAPHEHDTGGHHHHHGHRHGHSDRRHPRLARPQLALAHQFLEMISYGQGGRIFTYVLMLDGELRFTETGDHLAIQYLSKHTMHSDVAHEVAYSGEFFVRPYSRGSDSDSASNRIPIRDRDRSLSRDRSPPSPASDTSHRVFTSDSKNPHDYELILDNDSGTYRPQSSLLQTFREFLTSDRNFGKDSFGRVRVMEAFDETLVRWKEEWKKGCSS